MWKGCEMGWLGLGRREGESLGEDGRELVGWFGALGWGHGRSSYLSNISKQND